MTTRAKEGDASGTALGKEDGGRPEQLGIAPIVGGVEQGSSIHKRIDQPRGSFVRLLIQSGERLIEQHGVAGRQQGAQQLDAAPLAAGEPSNRGSGVDLGSQLPQQRCDGAGARARTVRSSVSLLTGISRRRASPWPGRPPSARPRWWTMVCSRAVRRA